LLEQPDGQEAIWKKDAQGMTAADLAEMQGFESMERLLERRKDHAKSTGNYAGK
jgi:hypothetical protein